MVALIVYAIGRTNLIKHIRLSWYLALPVIIMLATENYSLAILVMHISLVAFQ